VPDGSGPGYRRSDEQRKYADAKKNCERARPFEDATRCMPMPLLRATNKGATLPAAAAPLTNGFAQLRSGPAQPDWRAPGSATVQLLRQPCMACRAAIWPSSCRSRNCLGPRRKALGPSALAL